MQNFNLARNVGKYSSRRSRIVQVLGEAPAFAGENYKQNDVGEEHQHQRVSQGPLDIQLS
jgi:hypothetical protein